VTARTTLPDFSKVLICPYFGNLPPWMDHYWRNAERLREHGYNFLLDYDEQEFRERVREKLGIEPPPMWGTGKIWDFRPALGYLYADEIAGYEWWGHTDFDCVYGRVERWLTDEFLAGLDIFSNHIDYICGPWTLYRNIRVVNELFQEDPYWAQNMRSPTSTGWAETTFSATVDAFHRGEAIRRRYELWQTRNWDSFDTVRLEADGRLIEGREEVFMAHFRRTKQYPQGCIL